MTTTVKKTAKKAAAKKAAAPATPTTAPADTVPQQSAEPVRHDVGRLEYLDPHALIVDPFNHRRTGRKNDSTAPDPKLIASVRERGVRVPLLVRPQADGAMGIVWGQRRRAAALLVAQEEQAAGRPYAYVPCLVREDLAGADDEALIESMIENDQRAAADMRDDLDALEQLALMDMSDARRAKAARTLGYKPAEIKAANRAAKLSDAVLGFALGEEFDLLQTAEFAEVEDVPGAFDHLLEAKEKDDAEGKGGRGHWAHALEEMREEQRRRARTTEVEAELAAARIKVIPFRTSYAHTTGRLLEDLRTALDNPISAERHQADCAGHAAAIDPDTVEPVYLCTDWAKHGHTLPGGATAARTDTEGEAKQKEAEREARRRTIAHNKAWRTARPVRQEFITALCARKEISEPLRVFVLSMITGTGYAYSRYVSKKDTALMAQFLGTADPNADQPGWKRVADPFGAVIAKCGKARWWRPLLAQVCAAMESEVMYDGAWRTPTQEVSGWLALLAAEGYTLSEIEHGMAPAKPETPTDEADQE
ncbi:ParB N-terminal domain-containing protein [Streptomyces sp. NPDC051180]|uniref:ParB/RepB/Spo0J family partition protein n=1 Tax=unclassified Streptomyces TaxID=2593676 RepID=UPI00344E09C3